MVARFLIAYTVLAPLLAGLTAPGVQAQVCAGDVEVNTQAEMDAFNCAEIEGGLWIGAPFGSTHSSNIADLSSLAGLTSVGGELRITGTQVTDVDALSDLTYVGGSIILTYNPSLIHLDGLTNAEAGAPERLTVVGNSTLANIDGLAGVSGVKNVINIRSNSFLTSIDGLSGITGSVPGRLIIQGNPRLTNLDGLSGITESGSIEVGGLALVNIDGLAGITSVSGSVSVGGQYLESLDGLSSLTYIGESLSVSLGGFDSLDDLSGLSNLTYVGQDLRLSSANHITDLGGLASVTFLGGDLKILGYNALSNIDALAGLTAIGGSLEILDNPSLLNVDGLSNVATVGGYLYVKDNTTLSGCTVGIGSILESKAIGDWIVIADNAPGCNSVWEAMGGSVDAENEATPLVTGLSAPYPNPTAGTATFAFTMSEPGEVSLIVYDALGRRVTVLAEGLHPAGLHETALGVDMPAGVYVARLSVGSQVWTEPVTVVH